MTSLHRSPFRRRALAACGLAVALTGTVLFVGAAPAQAACPSDYESEAALAAAPAGCRHTFVVDPGIGDLLSRADLVAHAAYYKSFNFDLNYLIHGELGVIDVGPNSNGVWTYCKVSHTGPCPEDQIGESAFSTTFSQDTTLHVVSVGDTFIALVCGNTSPRRLLPQPGPSPTIAGTKVHDLDLDGHADLDEPGLGGWTITLRLVRSDIPALASVPDRTTTTAVDGTYSFSMSNQPPGLYELEESAQSGWRASSPARRTFLLPAGSGSTVFGANDFANVQQADVVKADFELLDASTTRLEAGQWKDLVVRAVLRNDGPTSAVDVDDELTITAPEDCTVLPQRSVVRRRLEDEDVVVDFPVRARCEHRSFHDFTLRNTLRVAGAGVVDDDQSDNTRSLTVTLPVFEPADLWVDVTDVECGERALGPSSFTCMARTLVGNDGSATDVKTLTAVRLSGPSDCTVVPTDAQAYALELDAGQVQVLVSEFAVSCTDPVRHSFVADAAVRVDTDADPHAEDRDLANNRDAIRWVPIDPKPRSQPSAVNVAKQGIVPVAILSTPDFDALAQVDRTSLRFGATGDESSLVGCKGTGEDVNDDGLLDLVCHFEATKTGLTCDDHVAVLTGTLMDGSPFQGHDDVKVTPCH